MSLEGVVGVWWREALVVIIMVLVRVAEFIL